uniref:condensation domain-containing protein n=1 Tax=Facilibium subflavum TaxID=2219058 RepID=UPI0013C2AB8A
QDFSYLSSQHIFNEYGPAEATISSLVSQIFARKNILGQPIKNNKIYILDNFGIPVTPNTIGEIYLAGIGLSRGYLNQPELTKQRFIDNPFATDEDFEKGYTRLYKTGDLARWLPDGNIEYMGRNDFQVKLRGQRVELGEIESALCSIDGIKQSCVIVDGENATQRLIGYYISDRTSKLNQDIILGQLASLLPSYMIPNTLIEMDQFPMTVNGKLDRKALPIPELIHQKMHVEPRNEAEQTARQIWSKVLNIPAGKIGIYDDFFGLGGNSILAIQSLHEMSMQLGREFQAVDIFKYKCIARLLENTIPQDQVVIPKVQSNQSILSFSQYRLWFIEKYEQGTNAYHIPTVFELSKDINLEAFKYAIQGIVSRHEVLRSIIIEPERQKDAVQVVRDNPLVINESEFDSKEKCKAAIKKDIAQTFDLSHEYPIRVKLYFIKQNNKVAQVFCSIIIHHIASDGWSINIFQIEFIAYYEAYIKGNETFKLPELEIQYKDYALWQRNYLIGDTLQKQLDYWTSKLSGYENLNLPTDYKRPNKVSYRGSSQGFSLDKTMSDKLRSLANEHGVTLYSVLLGSLSVLLGKYCNQSDIVIGSPTANRHYKQTESLIGFFVNTLVNRIVLTKAQSFTDLIQAIYQDQIEYQQYQDLPFEQLIDALEVQRDLTRHPVFQVMLVLNSFDTSFQTLKQKGHDYFKPVKSLDFDTVEKFDLTLFINDQSEVITGNLSYATDLFKPETIKTLIQYYQTILNKLVDQPNSLCSQMTLLTDVMYQKIVYDWNDTNAEYPSDITIHQLFEKQVKATPEHIAAVYQDRQITYDQLNKKANQLAGYTRVSHQKSTTKPPSSIT